MIGDAIEDRHLFHSVHTGPALTYFSSDVCNLSESFESPQTQMNRWSSRIAERYQCRLSPSLADWFDREIWKLTGSGEYREPIAPESLLVPAPDVIWPGLMCCDLLPLIGNAAGDWLCVRVDQDNVLSEVVQWYHGGGDWIPWGKDLPQAIIFDAAIERIPGAARRHAVPAENPRPVADPAQRRLDPLLQWARSHRPDAVAAIFDHQLHGHEIAEAMLEFQLAEVAVRCELVVALLTHWPRGILSALFRDDASLDRADLVKWSFDLDQMPEPIRQRLREQTGVAASQDWEAAAVHADRVSEIAPELAWAWEILGYAAERRGDLASAISAYQRASTCSVFTDQSIRLDTHWMAHASAKFSVARLRQLCPDQVATSSYFQILLQPDGSQRRQQATTYWTKQAWQMAEQNDHQQAHRCHMAAAWDLGAEGISSYASVLDRISESALRAGQSGRAEVARTHRLCLRDRYRV